MTHTNMAAAPVQMLNRNIEVVLVDPDLEHGTAVLAAGDEAVDELAATDSLQRGRAGAAVQADGSLADIPVSRIAVSMANPNRRPRSLGPHQASAAALMQAGAKVEVRGLAVVGVAAWARAG
jgi:hypothetical protein